MDPRIIRTYGARRLDLGGGDDMGRRSRMAVFERAWLLASLLPSGPGPAPHDGRGLRYDEIISQS